MHYHTPRGRARHTTIRFQPTPRGGARCDHSISMARWWRRQRTGVVGSTPTPTSTPRHQPSGNVMPAHLLGPACCSTTCGGGRSRPEDVVPPSAASTQVNAPSSTTRHPLLQHERDRRAGHREGSRRDHRAAVGLPAQSFDAAPTRRAPGVERPSGRPHPAEAFCHGALRRVRDSTSPTSWRQTPC